MKTRQFPNKNYKAIYFNGKTVRLTYNRFKPILDLDWPEFYDIKLTNRCHGRCPYCYQDSTDHSSDYEAVGKLASFFGGMTENQKPFQIAYGGGEPTLHPQFHEIMELTRKFDISPNYTTNGMFIDTNECDHIIDTTMRFCEGIAISCHPHLDKYWQKCAMEMISHDIFTNFHNIISDRASVDTFIKIYKKWSGYVQYFVALPMIEHGRAMNVTTDFDYFFDEIEKLDTIEDIAFGANFHDCLKARKTIPVTLYEPEIMSKYLDLKNMALYPSSFNTETPLRFVA